MAAPSVSGGITVLETCDVSGGASGVAPSGHPAGATIADAAGLANLYGSGINSTGCGEIGNRSAGAGVLVGGCYSISPAVNLTINNRLLLVHIAKNSNSEFSDISSSLGAMITAFSNGIGTQEAAWCVLGHETQSASLLPNIVDASRSADAHLYDASFDPTNITHIGIAASFKSGWHEASIDAIAFVEPYVIVGGEAANKASFETITNDIDSKNCALNVSPTKNIHLVPFVWKVGDGVTATYFEETLKVFEFIKKVDFPNGWGRAHIDDNTLGYETNASASNTIIFTLCVWLGDTPSFWNSLGSSLANVQYISCVVKNAGQLTIVDGHQLIGHLFDGCGMINANQPTLNSVTIKNAPGVALSVGDNGAANMSSCNFSGNQTAIRVDVAGNASLDVTEFTFDTSNTYYIEYTGSGTLTVTSPTSIDAGKLNASGGGTIEVAAGGSSVTFTGIPTDAEYRLYEDDPALGVIGTTELIGAETHAGGDVVYSFSSGAGNPAILQVMAAGYKERILSFNLPATPQIIPIELEIETNL